MLPLKRWKWRWKRVSRRIWGSPDPPFQKHPPPLPTKQIGSFDEYCEYRQSMSGEYDDRYRLELEQQKHRDYFFVPGFCFVCGRPVSFQVDLTFGFRTAEGNVLPNWRESLFCPECLLNNRMRAAIHIFHDKCHPRSDCALYLTEQTTAIYSWFKKAFEHTTGSEFLGSTCPAGFIDMQGIRHEDLTRLSFEDGQFDFILCFDVFEHIPNYRRAFRECRRVLKKGGALFFSIPFDRNSPRNIIRADLSPDGSIRHLLPPEYHADPLQSGGCLCFRHFGWECLDELREEGFSESAVLLFWSLDYGYLGGEQLLFISWA